jgi:hypothetical protein
LESKNEKEKGDDKEVSFDISLEEIEDKEPISQTLGPFYFFLSSDLYSYHNTPIPV